MTTRKPLTPEEISAIVDGFDPIEVEENESNESTAEPKLFGLPRAWAGALIGILLFWLVYLLSYYGAGFGIFSVALLAPGIWANAIVGSATYGGFLYYPIVFVASSIPPAVLGALFVSKKRGLKMVGVIVLVIYLIFSSCVALLEYVIALD